VSSGSKEKRQEPVEGFSGTRIPTFPAAAGSIFVDPAARAGMGAFRRQRLRVS
jgi:hypothetical protein